MSALDRLRALHLSPRLKTSIGQLIQDPATLTAAKKGYSSKLDEGFLHLRFDANAILQAAKIQGNEHVLEISEHVGLVTKRAAAVTGGMVYGLDRKEDNVRRAYSLAMTDSGAWPANLTYLQANLDTLSAGGQSLSFGGVKFNVVIISWLFHAFDSGMELFRALQPHLADNARLVITGTLHGHDEARPGGHIWYAPPDRPGEIELYSFDWSNKQLRDHTADHLEEVVESDSKDAGRQVAGRAPVTYSLGTLDPSAAGEQRGWLDISARIPTKLAALEANGMLTRLVTHRRRAPQGVDAERWDRVVRDVRQFIGLRGAVLGQDPPVTIKRWVRANLELESTFDPDERDLAWELRWTKLMEIYASVLWVEKSGVCASATAASNGAVVSHIIRHSSAIGVFRY